MLVVNALRQSFTPHRAFRVKTRVPLSCTCDSRHILRSHALQCRPYLACENRRMYLGTSFPKRYAIKYSRAAIRNEGNRIKRIPSSSPESRFRLLAFRRMCCSLFDRNSLLDTYECFLAFGMAGVHIIRARLIASHRCFTVLVAVTRNVLPDDAGNRHGTQRARR